MRTSRVYNVLQSPGTGVTATGTDFQLYCRAAAKNAKDKYAKRLIDNAASDYWGFYTPVWSPYRWRNVFDPLIAPMLRDAILITAQFLVAWMQVAKKAATPPGNVGNVAPRKAMNGYYTCVSAALAGTVWAVDAQQPRTPLGNVFLWNGHNWTRAGYYSSGVNSNYLTNISVGNASNVWGVDDTITNNQDNIWHWDGSQWTRIPGHLTQVSVAADGTVRGVNARLGRDNIWRRTGDVWERVKGELTWIAAGSESEVWGVNAQLPSDQTSAACSRSSKSTDGGSGGPGHPGPDGLRRVLRPVCPRAISKLRCLTRSQGRRAAPA